MTMKKAQRLGVFAKTQPTGDYGQTLWISVYVPAVFQLGDKQSKLPYNKAWNQSRALPLDHPFYSSLEKLKEHFRVSQMLFTVKDNRSYVEFVFTASNRDATTERLEGMFGSENITFS